MARIEPHDLYNSSPKVPKERGVIMRLLENLRNAEQKGVDAMRRGMVRAREEWGDLERRLRQRMRIYPQKLKKAAMAGPGMQEPGIPADMSAADDTATLKPIVSVHGRDVKEDELDKPAA